jgi:hypothetical protein
MKRRFRSVSKCSKFAEAINVPFLRRPMLQLSSQRAISRRFGESTKAEGALADEF